MAASLPSVFVVVGVPPSSPRDRSWGGVVSWPLSGQASLLFTGLCPWSCFLLGTEL